MTNSPSYPCRGGRGYLNSANVYWAGFAVGERNQQTLWMRPIGPIQCCAVASNWILCDYTTNAYKIQRSFSWSRGAACREVLVCLGPTILMTSSWLQVSMNLLLEPLAKGGSLHEKVQLGTGLITSWHGYQMYSFWVKVNAWPTEWGLVTLQPGIPTLEWVSSYSVKYRVGRAQQASLVKRKWYDQECSWPDTSSSLISQDKVAVSLWGKLYLDS